MSTFVPLRTLQVPLKPKRHSTQWAKPNKLLTTPAIKDWLPSGSDVLVFWVKPRSLYKKRVTQRSLAKREHSTVSRCIAQLPTDHRTEHAFVLFVRATFNFFYSLLEFRTVFSSLTELSFNFSIFSRICVKTWISLIYFKKNSMKFCAFQLQSIPVWCEEYKNRLQKKN